MRVKLDILARERILSSDWTLAAVRSREHHGVAPERQVFLVGRRHHLSGVALLHVRRDLADYFDVQRCPYRGVGAGGGGVGLGLAVGTAGAASGSGAISMNVRSP